MENKCRNPSFGLATKAKGLQGCEPKESPGVTSHILGSVGRCEGVNLHTPKATPTLGYGILVDSQNFIEWFRGQNSMACDVLYIIEKLLERRCLKWVALLIWTSKKKVMAKRRVGSQIGSLTPDHKKSGIDLIFVRADGVQHTVGKLSTRVKTLLENSSQLEVFTQNYRAPKSWESQPWRFRDSHLGVPRQKTIWMWALWKGAEYIIRGKVVASPKSGSWWVLCVHVARGSS